MDCNFKFALTPAVIAACPVKLADGTTLTAQDFLPKRSTATDTGWDVRCAELEGVSLCPFDYFKISLGFRVFAPEGWWLEVRPRSSTFAKEHIHALYGVCDNGYENTMMFAGQYINDAKTLISANECKQIVFGQKIAQIIPVKLKTMSVQEVTNEEFDKLCGERQGSRATGGFGSSGKF